MKIVQLVFHLGPGGAEKFVTDLSNELAARGHEVLVLMLRDGNQPEYSFNRRFLAPNVRVRSLGLKTGFHPGQIRIVGKALDEERPDVVHGHLGVMPYVYSYSLRNRKIRFVHTIHSVPSFDIRHSLLRRLASLFYKRTVTPVAISRTCADLFRGCYGFDARTIVNGRTVPDESEAYAEIVREFAALRRPVFVHVARFAPEKNQALLLEAFSRLDREGIPFTLLVIGEGFSDQPECTRYASDKIRFLGSRSNVCDYLRLSDAFCLSSRIEGSPISLIEAFACGATPVCTPAGGIPDMIKDTETGYISSGFKTEDFLEAIHAFLRCPIPRERLIRYYEAHFTMQQCATQYLEVYNERLV